MNEHEKISGFRLCEFKAEEDDVCDCCDEQIEIGADIYYERQCYETDDGTYYCKKCTIETPERMQREADSWGEYAESVNFGLTKDK